MSEHDIADCPKCGKRDFILKENGHWVCLKCDYTKKMPISVADPESNPNNLTLLIAAFIVAMFMMVLVGV